MKKTLLVGAIALLFPFVASAAWWNPFTWSLSDTPTPDSIEQGTTNVDVPSATGTENEPVPEPTPTVTIKYVTDPNMALQIQELQKENEALNRALIDQRSQFVSRLNACKENSTASASPQKSKISELNDRFTTITDPITELIDKGTPIETLWPLSIVTDRLPEIKDVLTAYKIVDPNFSAPIPTSAKTYTDMMKYMQSYITYKQ